MFSILQSLHFLALAFGAVASLGNVYLVLSSGPHDLAAPGFTNQLRKLYRFTALVALAVFWITGLLMLFARYGLWLEGFGFNAKILLVGILTLSVVFINLMSPQWGRSGGPPAYVKYLHWLNAFLLIGAIILAAIAFN